MLHCSRKKCCTIAWDKELKGKDTNDAFLFIKSRIEEQISKHIPLSKPRKGQRYKPFWMNQTTLAKVKKKHQAYKRYLKTKNGKEYAEYARARNQASRGANANFFQGGVRSKDRAFSTRDRLSKTDSVAKTP